jgi:ribose 1,5-bisphosphokinase PhnN
MAEPLADQVLRKIGEARELYHRLILMVGPAGSGKTSALQEVSASTSLSACGHARQAHRSSTSISSCLAACWT